MNGVKVSIIMSTSNTKEKFLRIAIDSILKQNYKDYEFIIVNDSGEDKKIINTYKDRRIKIIDHKEQKGLPYSLNEAIKVSKGKYIARMDSDDISVYNRIKTQVKYMEKHQDIGLCAMFYKKFDKENEFIYDLWNKPEDIKCQLFFTNVIAHPVVMFRKSFLIDNDLSYCLEYPCSQDFELWTRCSKYGKIKIIPKLGLYYRMHSSQISSSKKELQNKLYESVLIRNLNELEFEEKNLKYLKMLNGKQKSIMIDELSDFIDEVILRNNEKKIYDGKTLKKILYNMFFVRLMKNKLINIKLITNKSISKKLFKFYNLVYMIKKIYFEILVKVQYSLDKTIKNCEICE